MVKIRSFNENIDIENKNVILRSDFNVPIKNSLIQDETRINLSIPFIQNLLKRRAKVLLISHLGRPKSNKDKSLSLKPVFNYLKKKISNKLYFHSDEITNKTKEKISFLNAGEIIFFENIRLSEGEIKNDDHFAKNLSSIGEIYINDAFSCSHRKQASIHKITKYIKDSYAGPLLMKEVLSINMVLHDKKSPITCIIGGSKISTKIGVIRSLIKKVDNLVIVGAMANNFIKYQNKNVGKSIVEAGVENIIEKINSLAIKSNCKLIIPIDCNASDNINGSSTYKSLDELNNEDIILDIGKNTINLISKTIDDSNTVFWNGPAGYYENKSFSKGTIAIAKKISENTKRKSLISIVGGGDTIAAIKNTGLENSFTHLSTAGGAFLECLEGRELPGIKVLRKN